MKPRVWLFQFSYRYGKEIWEISVAVARLVKERFPDCLVVFGGPQVPNRMEGFFEQYPFVDLTVHGEGEITFSEILKARAADGDYGAISGLSHRGGTNPARARARELDAFPSPYLTGVFDELLAQPYDFGILERDVRIAAYPAETKTRSGYPEKFRVNFTKNSSERVRDIAKILSERHLAAQSAVQFFSGFHKAVSPRQDSHLYGGDRRIAGRDL